MTMNNIELLNQLLQITIWKKLKVMITMKSVFVDKLGIQNLKGY